MKYKIEITKEHSSISDSYYFSADLFKKSWFLFFPQWSFVNSEIGGTAELAKKKVAHCYAEKLKLKDQKQVEEFEFLGDV